MAKRVKIKELYLVISSGELSLDAVLMPPVRGVMQ